MTWKNPTCPRCDQQFIGMRSEVRFKKYITARYIHNDKICRVIYMLPRDAKKIRKAKA